MYSHKTTNTIDNDNRIMESNPYCITSVRFPHRTKERIEECVKKGYAMNSAEFIRMAVEKFLTECDAQ